MNYTDTQLKQALARMLPEQLFWADKYQSLVWDSNEKPLDRKVLNTELLHLCWLVEETLDEVEFYNYVTNLYLVNNKPKYSFHNDCHSTWQQRTIALAKVKEVEI